MKYSAVIRLLALVLALTLAASGCTMRPEAPAEDPAPATAAPATPVPETAEAATPTPEATAAPTEAPTPTPTPTPTPEPKELVNPLTGEPSEVDYSGKRPVAVMIENNRIIGGPVITMYGINDADIIYETQVEKITRCMGVYMDIADVKQICPVRSARTYFVGLALGLDAIIVHRGASSEGVDWATTMLAENFPDADDVDLGKDNSYNISTYPHTGEHSMCTSGELLTKHFTAVNTRMEHKTAEYDYGMIFSADAKAEGEAANSVRIVFPEYKITSFTYNADKGGYIGTNWDLRWDDANTGEPGVFENVIIMDTVIQTGLDGAYHSSVKLENTEGKGYFCNGGAYEPITWKRGTVNEPIRYYDADGNELELGIGRTYVGIISLARGGVTFG